MIGITGPPGSGKSTAASMVAGSRMRVIDVDGVGHEILRRPDVTERLRGIFGAGIVKREGEISRKRLAEIVFSDRRDLEKLEAVLHPLMVEDVEQRIAAAKAAAVDGVVIDAAVLFEMGLDRLCDTVLFVDAPREIRLARCSAARGWTDGDVRARESMMRAASRAADAADCVVKNDDSIEKLNVQLHNFMEER